MRTFAQKPKAQQAPAKSRALGPSLSGLSRQVNPLPRFPHDVSRLLIHPPAAEAIQPDLAISKPGDSEEREADRIAEQIIQTPGPHILTQDGHAGDSGQIVAPGMIHEVLAAPGQTLDPPIRGFMESRFGHDFSQVRIHADHHAARSAEAVAAQAYTVGADVVFGMGRYAPANRDGQRLLAHELAHVVQQESSHSTPGLVQRSPDNKKQDSGTGVPADLLLHSVAYWPNGLSSDQEIQMLAANPDHAHYRWKGLALQAQIGVAVNMALFYGAPFATQFVDIHKAAKVPPIVMGQQVGSDTTPAQLTARGFRLAGTQAQMNVEIWFHPSGNRMQRVIPAKLPEKPPAPKQAPEPEPQLEEGPEEDVGAPVELADLTDGQRKALVLIQRMEHMNADFQKMLDANPAQTSEFIDKEPQFRAFREQLHQLVLDDDSISDPDFSSILIDRKAAVETFVQLRNRAYGTDIGDWEKIEHEPAP